MTRRSSIALSDHGFGPYRRAVHLNAWLLEKHGLLHLKPGLEPGESAGDMLRGVDWSRTKAYSLGLGGIYLNLRGREAEGIVDQMATRTGSRARSHGGSAACPTRSTARPRSGASSLARRSTPARSWARRPTCSSTFGGLPGLVEHFDGGRGRRVFEDNRKKWSGDHIVDPALVPGVLLIDRPFRGEGARLEDLAPTILEALGRPQGDEHGREFLDLMKILVIGLDGAAPEILLEDDRLANIRCLMEAGAFGRLESIVPPITVPAWLCMSTSRDPGSLGVYGFRNRARSLLRQARDGRVADRRAT